MHVLEQENKIQITHVSPSQVENYGGTEGTHSLILQVGEQFAVLKIVLYNKRPDFKSRYIQVSY